MKKLLAILFSVLFFLPAAKGQNGEIYGSVNGALNSGMAGVSVYAYLNDSLILCSTTDSTGEFSLRPLTPGSYVVKLIGENYLIKQISEVIVYRNGSTRLKVKLIKHQ